jgi:UDP-N-acetylmuramate dehydrogenase
MALRNEVRQHLNVLNSLEIVYDAPLREYTRFGIGGPADALIDASDLDSFAAAERILRGAGVPHLMLGGGTNLIVSDEGYRGAILRYRGSRITVSASSVTVEAGAELQALVDCNAAHGLAGTETLTGIPGWVGAAIYGNAGAYGQSIHQRLQRVRFWDGTRLREFTNAECGFRYRWSEFKRHKEWTVIAADFALDPGDAPALQARSGEIRAIRDAKYPPTMKCAGSIFKNFILNDLPPDTQRRVPPPVVKEGKVPSAWFLEQVGAKGMRRGAIRVADYHANLIYNEGAGTAADLCALIDELKDRIRREFAIPLEEEVQYVGFPHRFSH